MCIHVYAHALASSASRIFNSWEGSPYGSGWTVSCYCAEEAGMIQGCLLDSFQNALAVWLIYIRRLKKKNHKERHSAGGEDFELCQHIHEHRAEARWSCSSFQFASSLETDHLCIEVWRNLNGTTPYSHCNLRNASSNLSGEGTGHYFAAARSSKGLWPIWLQGPPAT